MNQNAEIIVVGGGFTGAAFALAAADAGLGVHLIAAGRPDGSDGRASAITAASRRMLEAIGVWRHLGDAAQPVNDMEISDGRLDDGIRPPFLLFDTGEGADDGGPAAFIVDNDDLLDAFAAALAANRALQVTMPALVSGFERGVDGIKVLIAGADGARQASAPARLLVAADGARSVLRREAGIKTVEWSYGQWGLVGPISVERDHGGKAVQHFLPAGPFAFLPLPGRRGSLVWAESEAEARRLLALDTDALEEELHRRLGHGFGRARFEAPLRGYPLRFVLARAFTAERLALIGDAAHHVHPLAGQGLNLGLKDAAALAETLAEAARIGLDIGSGAVLERYQRWRRFDVTGLAATTDALNRLFSNDVAAMRAVRQLGLGLVERVSPLKRWLVREAAGDTGAVPRLMRGEAI